MQLDFSTGFFSKFKRIVKLYNLHPTQIPKIASKYNSIKQMIHNKHTESKKVASLIKKSDSEKITLLCMIS